MNKLIIFLLSIILVLSMFIIYLLYRVEERNEDQSINTKENKQVNNKAKHNILAVQVKHYKRYPINNRDFEFIHVEKDHIKFRNYTVEREDDGRVIDDHLKILNLIYNYNYEYYFLLEDDCFFCWDLAKLEKVMKVYDAKIVVTGWQGSGIVIHKDYMEKILLLDLNENAKTGLGKDNGLDILIQHHFLGETYKTKSDITAHLYEGSLLGHPHGSQGTYKAACFEMPDHGVYKSLTQCAPNDLYKISGDKCVPEEILSDEMPYYNGNLWINRIREQPIIRKELAKLDKRIGMSEKK
eukprot:TRINITY_DN12777_c0_g1_i1.p1 TRINITY_DN12777_c0_g1~~TRINITY_DN12777_c0_g1_i1.p1  ORF type:complete len:296 (+),score=65.82 TRINITY_DN12777_c0_g1_i1:77-964(+)